MTKKNVYLHVGTPKTGSTTIQHFLTSNRDVLAQKGAAVYTALESNLADCMRQAECLDPSFASDNGKAWTRTFVQRIQGRPEETIILSEEMCWFSIVLTEKRPLFLYFIEQLKTVANITIVVYLRRQDLFLMSSYREFLKSGWLDGKTCRQHLKGMDHQFLHYREPVEWLASVAGRGRLMIRPFEAGQFVENSLIRDFMHCIGQDFTEDYKHTEKILNPSMSPFLTEVMRCLSFFRYTRQDLSVFWASDVLKNNLCYNETPEQSSVLSPHERKDYLRRFADENRWIARELLQRTDGILFKDPLPLENERWEEYKLNPDEVRCFFRQAYFLTPAQRRKMCRQVLSVCKGKRPLALRIRDGFEKTGMKRKQTDNLMEWLNGAALASPPACSAEPLFSIILPVHNRIEKLALSLKSIHLQDLSDFEVIVIDDASTDDTPGMVARMAQNDPRIKLIRLDKNMGPGPARNAGIAQARGKYIRICDSDDFYPQGALSAFARQIAESEDDLIAGNLICWHSELGQTRPFPGPWQIHRQTRSDDLRQVPELWAMVHFHRCAFRREFLIENGIEYPAMRRGEDPVYMAEVLSKARSFSLMSDAVYLFHERPREQNFSYAHVRDAVSAHAKIRRIMTHAGYPDLGFFFDCYYSPFSLSHAGLTEEESLRISEQLIDFAKEFPLDLLGHSYLDHSACDKIALHHDLLVAKNQTPEQIAELFRRGMFCGQEHLKQNEIEQLHQKIRTLHQRLKPFRPVLRVINGVRRRLSLETL